jgi:hypothetical protein
VNEYTLSDVERKLLLDLNSEAQRASAAAIAPFNAQSQGVLTLIALQQGLAGSWKLSDDKTTLVKQEG